MRPMFHGLFSTIHIAAPLLVPGATSVTAPTRPSFRFATSYGTHSDMKPTRMHVPGPAGQVAPPRRQRGVVLFVSLIVMVALSLAAIALIRSVDTTNAIVGNLAFRLASILPANASIEQAAGALFQDQDSLNVDHITDKKNDLPDQNYYACRRGLPTCGGPAEDPRTGVPGILQKKSTAATLIKRFDALDTDTH